MTKGTPVKSLKHASEVSPVRAGTPKGVGFWPEGLTPFDFQLLAVAHASTYPISYLALDAGLGKTIVARVLLNALSARSRKVWRVYFVCPPFLMANVQAEFSKWGTSEIRLRVVPDSALGVRAKLVDLLWDVLTEDGPMILIVDEAHRFKNEKSKRTKGLFTLAKAFRRMVFLSGTPMPNSRPMELWPILRRFAPQLFGTDFFRFAKTYCGARRTIFGWKFDGFTNRNQFKATLFNSGFMLRLKKAECISLPPKIESIITVGDNMPAVISALERKVLSHYSPEDLVQGKLAAANSKALLHLSEYLKLLGEYKLKYALPFIENLLEETSECLILFARHRKVIDQLKHHFAKYEPTVIDGSVPTGKRQGLVTAFQNSSKRLFIGNIDACGIGLTITRPDRVIFLEFSWRDGDNSQAADRVHRIGQGKTVLVQYVVLSKSIDAKRMQVLLTKRQNAV